MSWVQVRSQYPVFVFVAKKVYSMFFALWGSWMILSGLKASLVLWFGSWQNEVFYYWSAKLSLDSMLLILGLAGFNIFFPFQNAGFSVFQGKMSSWCSFRCTCLDGLGSKSDFNILYLFCCCCCCCKMCAFHVIRTVRLMGDWFCSGGFFGVVIGFVFNICIC